MNATGPGKSVWQKLLLGGTLGIVVARQTHESPASTSPRESRGNRVFHLPSDYTPGRDHHVSEEHVRRAEAPPREDVGAPERRCRTCLRGGRALLRGHVTGIGLRGNGKRGVRARPGERVERSPIGRRRSESSSDILAWAVRFHPIRLDRPEASNQVQYAVDDKYKDKCDRVMDEGGLLSREETLIIVYCSFTFSQQL